LQKELMLQGVPSPRSSPATSPEYKKWLDEVPLRQRWNGVLEEMRKNGSSEVGLPAASNKGLTHAEPNEPHGAIANFW